MEFLDWNKKQRKWEKNLENANLNTILDVIVKYSYISLICIL